MYVKPQMDLFFDNFFNYRTNDTMVKTPVHDVIENEKEFQIELLLAGIKKDDINIDIENDILTISAERKEDKDLKYNRKETYFGKYKRGFTLSDEIDKENISASFVDGILKVIVPKLNKPTKLSKKVIKIT